MGAISHAGRLSKRAVNSNSHWIERLGRIGYATKGAVYALIGVLAILAVIGEGGSLGGSGNAVREIGSQPFGQVLLVLTAIGLFGYALWRFVQAALDPENKGTDGKGTIKRTGYAISGFTHAFLGVTAVQLVTGGGSGSSQKTWLAKLMAVDTIGPILVGLIGAIALGYAGYQVYKGWTLKFRKELKTGEMSRAEERAVTLAGRIGLIARGIVFAIVGGFTLKAAVNAQAGQAKTFGDALHEIASQSYGTVLLLLIAAGLVAYAVLQVALARYRKFPNRAA